jgi:hypothetical protein
MKKLVKIENQQTDKSISLQDRLATMAQLAIAANKNPKKLCKLETFLNRNPDLREQIAFLVKTVRNGLLKSVAKERGGTQTVIIAEMEGMKESLMDDGSTPLELLLIEAVMLCWLRVQHAELYRTQVMGEGHPLAHYEFADKMLTRAHNRYLKAIETLAKLRRLNQQKRSDSFNRALKGVKLLNVVNDS